MTVEIVKPGKKPEQQKYRSTCERCECEFTFNGYDATKIEDQREGNYFQVDCPDCRMPVTMTTLETA